MVRCLSLVVAMIDGRHAGDVASKANRLLYQQNSKSHLEGSPHLTHLSLRLLYLRVIRDTYQAVLEHSTSPLALDLGAGEGSASLLLLELGARVVAVDASELQLLLLGQKCARYQSSLEVREAEALDFLIKARAEGVHYDLVVATALLHHVPDYLALVRAAAAVLNPWGSILTFQDPMRYDRQNVGARLFSNMSFFAWRVRRPDVVGGVIRRLRRTAGIYRDDCPQDNAEYHALRGGVDEEAVARLLISEGFDCTMVKYFSTPSRFFQRVGEMLRTTNTFGIVAHGGLRPSR